MTRKRTKQRSRKKFRPEKNPCIKKAKMPFPWSECGSTLFKPDSLNIFPKINDGHCDRIHFSLTAEDWSNAGYMGKQPVAWKEKASYAKEF